MFPGFDSIRSTKKQNVTASTDVRNSRRNSDILTTMVKALNRNCGSFQKKNVTEKGKKSFQAANQKKEETPSSMESLAFKLQKQQRRLKSTTLKTRPTLLISKEELRRVVKNFPTTSDMLSTFIGENKAAVYGEEILKIIEHHPRDQAAFLDCVLEMEAFVRGGDTGVYILDGVYRQILGHFKMMGEINEIFDILDLCTHQLTGKLKRKYHRASDEEGESTFQWASKRTNSLSQ
jgi:hypothetical protein